MTTDSDEERHMLVRMMTHEPQGSFEIDEFEKMKVVAAEWTDQLETTMGELRRAREANEKLKEKLDRELSRVALVEAERAERQDASALQKEVSRLMALVDKTETGFLGEQRARREV